MSDPQSSGSSPPSVPGGGFNRFFALFPSIMLPLFLSMIDQTIVAAALPAIAGDLGSADRISWVVIAYLMAATIASPVYGRLGDVFGRKKLMIVALIIVIVASMLCGLSSSLEMLTAARLLQGVGGGGMMTLSQALIGEAVPPRERARYQGFLASVGVFSTAFGAVGGGLLTQHFGWRSVFFVGVPVGLLALVLMRRLRSQGAQTGVFQFDLVGLFLFAVFIASTLVVLREIQGVSAGMLLSSLGLSALALVALALLILRERRVPHPLFPLALFRDPAIWRSDAMALCHGAALVSLITFLPIYFRVGLGANAGQIGLSLLPVTVCVPLGSILTGQLVARTGRTAIFPSVGLAGAAATLTAIAIWLPELSAAHLPLAFGLCTLFMGTLMAVVQVTVQSAAGPAMLGTAAASVQFSRSIGAAVGTAIVGVAVFTTMATVDAEAAGLFADVLRRGPEVLAALPPGRSAIVQAEFVDAFRVAFLVIAGFEAIAMVITWSLPLRRI